MKEALAWPEIQYRQYMVSNFASMLTQKAIFMKHVLEVCFSCVFEHKSK